MRRSSATAAVVVLVTVGMATSMLALPLLGGGTGNVGDAGADTDGVVSAADGQPQFDHGAAASGSDDGAAVTPLDRGATNSRLVSMEPTTASASDGGPAVASLSQAQEDAVETGVQEGIDLVQSQGVEVTQEQEAAAIEGARESVAQHQEASVEQVQEATKGAVHGTLIQQQRVEVEQVQSAVGGATDGALAQYQTVEASQMQSATWGATHGAIAQKQRATVEQIQVATRGAAAGAASEAGDKDVREQPKIQEAAQGAAYGVLEQYQKITVEQRQRTTLEHVQNAAAGASAGALDGSTRAALEGEQDVDVEQRQRVTIKQVQKAAAGAAAGAIVQKQAVSVEQTQAAARGAGSGPLKQVQRVTVRQVQRISITQIQEASFGAAKGSITQSQEATVEQIQAAADGASQGVLVQQQEVSITQIQYAALGAAKGSIESAVQRQIVEVEQIQAAARGAGEGAVIQKQIVDVVQVQKLAEGTAGGVLVQHQEATIEQIQIAARGASQETARVVQFQRISVTQLQILSQETASDTAAFAVDEGVDGEAELRQFARTDSEQRLEEVDELEGEASIAFEDRESAGDRVVIDEVSLSEGGFVALYAGDDVGLEPDAVLGVSEFLGAGTHENVEIQLDDAIAEEQPLVAAVHLDTDDDGAFDYADTGGEDDPPYVTPGGSPVLDTAVVAVGDEGEVEDGDAEDEAAEPEGTLSVANQTGDGTNLTIAEANASVEYVLTAAYDGETVESETFDANESIENESLDLDPPIEENTTVDVALVGPDSEELTNETIEYAIADEADGDDEAPEASLTVEDQDGDGGSLVVDEATASVEYVLTVTDEDGEQLGESDAFGPDETIENESLDLEPPLEDDAALEVAVVAAGEDGDDATLANETIEYTVEDEAPEASLSVENQTGDGTNLTVEAANASVEYALTVTDEDGQEIGETGPFAPGDPIQNETIDLDPPLEDDATLEVAVVSAVDPEADPLATETIEYTVAEEFAVEYLDCSNAEVTGTFEEGDEIIVTTGFYESGADGNSIGEYAITVGEDVSAPFDGTFTYETGEEFAVTETEDGATVEVPSGDFGAAITGFASPDATPGEIDYPNPDAEQCILEVRPELPAIGVVETTPTDDGIDVTFGYDNSNDAPLIVGSEFVEGTTVQEPIEELQPGENTFTVEWTPESDDERLVWEVDMTGYDYEEVLTAETATAGEIAPSDAETGETGPADEPGEDEPPGSNDEPDGETGPGDGADGPGAGDGPPDETPGDGPPDETPGDGPPDEPPGGGPDDSPGEGPGGDPFGNPFDGISGLGAT
ncbi:hypothetical protein ACFO5R_15440 [Halosolutus amylolyticus]|uniref:DUF7282 domain-containing protein n=1 Tax=Halosolutus amylolyticus TaxID=2932267 RepID=A0ABD5PS75_9EURY|nr:hypothetical protein [Halosolutus amylolyticus]